MVYRHAQEPRGRVTLLVDFLTDPADDTGFLTLLRWVDREARAADSDKIRTFAMHEGFRKLLRRSGYYSVRSPMEFVAKVNGPVVGPGLLQGARPLARDARRLRSGSMMADVRPALLVAIDTEGDNQWDAAARRRQTSTTSTRSGVCTIFLHGSASGRRISITYPVAQDDGARTRAGGWRAEATARSARTITRGKRRRSIRPTSIGTHTRSSLPLTRFDEQLSSLTTRSTRPLARRPMSYRSGRFGFSAAHVSSLEQQGYAVESSVAPLFYEAHKGGPDFVGAPLAPYFLSYDDATNRVQRRCSSCLSRPRSTAGCRLARTALRAGAVALHDETPDETGAPGARSMAASVVQLG